MRVISASEAKARFQGLVDDVNDSHEPVLIKGARAAAVLVAESDWRAIQETLSLVSMPGMRDSIKAGMDEGLAESARGPGW